MSTPPLSPARARMLQALQRRAQTQPPAVAQRIAQRLQALAPAALPAPANVAAAPPTAPPTASPTASPTARPPTPTAAGMVAWPRVAHPSAELASALRFQKVWARHRTLERISLAGAQRPANAGPLNSHALALQTLQQLHRLPGGYLHRFIVQLEALMWLEAVAPATPSAAPRKAARAAAGTPRARSVPRR